LGHNVHGWQKAAQAAKTWLKPVLAGFYRLFAANFARN